MLGGAMRQSGVLAAAALYAVQHHRDRLGADHEAARRMARALAECPYVIPNVDAVETNIVIVELTAARAAEVAGVVRGLGVLCHPVSPTSLRLVTHLDFALDAVEPAARRLIEAITRVYAA